MTVMYDVHTHVGLDQAFSLRGWWPYAATAQDLLQHMDANGIDRGVCFPFTVPSAFDPYEFAERQQITLLPGRVPFDRENTLLINEVERIDKDRRLLPFAMFDPGRRVEEQLAHIEPLVGRIAGLKTQTSIVQSPIRLLLEDASQFMAFARQHRLPVLLHASVEPEAVHAQVADCLAVAEAYPQIRFCLAHTLGFHRDFLREAAAMPNVWVDCAALLAQCQLAREGSRIVAPPSHRMEADYCRPDQVLLAAHAILGTRFCWGSDNPFMSWCDDTLRIIYSYRQEAAVLFSLPEPVRLSVAGENSESWLFG